VIGDLRQGVKAAPILVGAWQSGEYPQAMTHVTGSRLLVTTSAGIVEIQRNTGKTRWALRLQGCSGRAFISDDKSLTVLCRGAAVRWRKDTEIVELIGGALGVYGSLVAGPDGQIWAISTAGGFNDGSLTLTQLGERPGEERRYEIDHSAGVAQTVWLNGRRFFLSGDGHSAVVDLDQSMVVDSTQWIVSPLPDPRATVARRQDEIIVASVQQALQGSVHTMNVITGESIKHIDLTVNRIYDIALTSTTSHRCKAVALVEVGGNDPLPHPMLIEIELPA
jgi:hypothetical protein